MKFCDKLQKIRKEHNITQEGLADKLDVSRQAVSKWESGTAYPDTEKLIQISKMFNVSLDDLINDNTDINRTNVEKKISFKEIFDVLFGDIYNLKKEEDVDDHFLLRKITKEKTKKKKKFCSS